MPNIDLFLNFLYTIPPTIILLTFGFSLFLICLFDFSIVSLFALLFSYIALAALTLEVLYGPVVLVRVVVGIGTSSILAVTAWQRLRSRRRLAREMMQAKVFARNGLAFRFLLVALGLVLTIALSQLSILPVPYNLGMALSGLTVVGILLVLTSLDSLQKGLGLLILLNGLESLYLALAPSMLVITLLSVVDILLVVAVAYMAGAWEDLPEAEEPIS